MKKIIRSLLIFGLSTIIAILLFDILFDQSFNIKIENKTTQKIEGLRLTFTHAAEDIPVPVIQPGDTITLALKPNEHIPSSFSESSLTLSYQDADLEVQEETIIGYLEKGYTGKADITIKRVNSEGELELDIASKTNLY
ncbi:hypothetical protein [Radiobacillus deserti]|uniref:Uncharacterized protein n=1 Tax=Radiobacillus deserti TaxID=2594883 RepID=A0A516KI90_9BACI|nr:hypothetical protein [Radiobacillus deserti]QDP41091.1 hypothetical protein FN924_13355 [Radiobacillus deserti]